MTDAPKPLPTIADIEGRYKVCEGCERLICVQHQMDDCPVCGSQRFDHSIDRINAAVLAWNQLGAWRRAEPRNLNLMIWEDFNMTHRGR